MGLFETMMDHAREYAQAVGTPENDGHASQRLSPCELALRSELENIAPNSNSPVRLDLLFSGDVQGVGFRWTNQSLAQERHLTGWVKNLPDGTVRMEIQGPARALLAHLERIHAYYARFSNRIWLEQGQRIPALPDQTDFDVRL
ncbi:MAG: acylphosphatase [Coriobacteriaceae bacterium]|nr:acylphosphatase [Coriobacteriaceae bacterium]